MPLSQGKGKQPQRETIEVEDDDARLQRIQRALEKLNTISPTTGIESLLHTGGTSQPGPASGESLNDLLARVQAFLPEMQASNAALAEKAAMDPRSVDIENVEGDEKIIQMNLGLGVFEDRTGKERSASDEESSDADAEGEDEDDLDDSDEHSTSTEDTDTTDESSSDEESANPGQGRQFAPLPQRALLSRPTKPLPRRARPEIVVLSETTTDDN
ncbi:hypothetical protein DFH09DRAFT_147836 [Mycena vulgaris]|nr:hypothetical protein DFH09DRAFT_147836 [Mycena vulgaris]